MAGEGRRRGRGLIPRGGIDSFNNMLIRVPTETGQPGI